MKTIKDLVPQEVMELRDSGVEDEEAAHVRHVAKLAFEMFDKDNSGTIDKEELFTALMDLGRPESVRLLCLVDRGLRELPIRPDFVGRTVPTTPGEEVRVRLDEEDGVDGVWLVERQGSGSG